MPKYVSIGTSLGLISRFANQRRAAASQRRGPAPVARAAMETLEDRLLMSRSWYVAPTGNNNNAGTLASPFQTIQQAANVAGWGDTVYIEGGTYRETVKPVSGGVTFANYNNQAVTVSGTDVVSGFSNYSGSIYKAYMPEDLGAGNNEVFVNGKPVNEARFPNTSTDLLHQTQAKIGSYSNNTIYDSSLNQPNGYWTGATIHITPGAQWVGYTGTVTNSGPGWITVSLPSTGSSEQPTAGNPYYLTGKFQALDSSGEWYRDNSGNLYLWGPNSENPGDDTVEVKAREYAFDLSNVSNTTIQGLNIFGATIHTGSSSTSTVINGITAYYITQFNNISTGWWTNAPLGIELSGSNSTLENSTIAYSAGDGVFIGGSNVTVTNNVIHDVDASGTDDAGIRIYGTGANISHNSIYNTGRDGINIQAATSNISYNVIHDAMLLTQDGAGVYTVNMNGQGATIANNYIYNVNAGGYGAAGIMLDNYSSNFNVHDNTTAKVGTGLRINYSSYNEHVYNNQLGANNWSIESNASPGQAYDWSGSQFYNNTYYKGIWGFGSNASSWSNTTVSGSPSAPSISVPTAASQPTTTSTPPVSASPTPDPVQTPSSTSSGSTSSGSSSSSSTFTATGTGVSGATLFGSQSDVSYATNGTMVKYSSVNLGSAATGFAASVGMFNAAAGGQIVLHLDSPTGAVIGTLNTNTGSYQTVSTGLTGASGVHDLYLVRASGGGTIGSVAWFNVTGAPGTAGSTTPTPVQTPSTSSSGSSSSSTFTATGSGNSGLTLFGSQSTVSYATNGTAVKYSGLNFGGGASNFAASVGLQNPAAGGQIVLHLDSPTGAIVGTLYTNTGSYQTVSTGLTGASGIHDLYLVRVGGGAIAEVAWLRVS